MYPKTTNPTPIYLFLHLIYPSNKEAIMQFEEHHTHSPINITGYQEGSIEINGKAHTQALCLLHQICLPCLENNPLELTAETFLAPTQNQPPPEVIIVGTGAKQIFLHPKITATLAAQGIGLESMNTAAACRTFMILQSEGRHVWAWLYP